MMNTKPSLRAIVIEDDASWQQILSEILSDSGLTVDVADNLEDALKLLKAEPHRLALVDLSLESTDHCNEDGLQALEAIKRLDPGCQSILLTGFATVELAVSALTELGAFSFLRKESFNRAQFRELISQALVSAPKSDAEAANLDPVAKNTSNVKIETVSHKTVKVLVVEDDAGWRSILSELLTDAGLEIRVCSSFGDALGALRRETFSLAVVDLSLTAEVVWDDSADSDLLEGYSLLANTHTAGIPTIVVSGVVGVDEIQRAYNEHSVFAYLEKQAFDRNTFRRLVREAIAAGSTISELDQLTQREREVFDLLAKGMTNKEIAEVLVITNNTVKRHLKAVFEKLDVHTRAAALSKARGNQ
ncbi:MAG: DNA-binding response regulator [Anaerolineaceae bacterium]|nr:DNA-binding response regulator [Anaerolineaceae bacterium]